MAHSTVKSSIIGSKHAIAEFIDNIQDIPNEPEDPPPFYVNLELQKLSKPSHISLATIYVHPKNHIYLVDIQSLLWDTFTTPGHNGWTLKDVLESEHIAKVFFDVRDAATVLYAQYNIKLQGVQDIQLMQNASRQWANFKELSQCIRRDTPISTQEKTNWMKLHVNGPMGLSPTRGGTYEILPTRPLSETTVNYCKNEVLHLPELRKIYLRRLHRGSKNMLPEVTKKKVLEALRKTDEYRRLRAILGPRFQKYFFSDISWILPVEFGKQLLQ